jgi:geranylgeranyl pyrophosphate synthase
MRVETAVADALGTSRATAGLAEMAGRIEAALPRVLDRELRGAPDGVASVVRYAVLGSGKRLRPLLLLASWRAASGQGPDAGDPAAELACSVELVHAYSLVHDDLPCMDDDVLRRGRPTVHVRFGTPAAILAGAALMPMAARTVWAAAAALGLESLERRRLLALLADAAGAGGMVGGQLLDLRAEGKLTTREELERIHRGKTAALMEASVRMGAVAARAPEATVERLGCFGRALGLAFQAVDDILDVTGEEAEIGKTSGRDVALGKATYPSVLGLADAERVSRELAATARRELTGLDATGELEALAAMVVERRR